jgi:predicted RNA methylase
LKALTKVLSQIRETMQAIRHTLIERWYAFETARSKAMTDPEVDLYATSGQTGLINSKAAKREVRILDNHVFKCAH